MSGVFMSVRVKTLASVAQAKFGSVGGRYGHRSDDNLKQKRQIYKKCQRKIRRMPTLPWQSCLTANSILTSGYDRHLPADGFIYGRTLNTCWPSPFQGLTK